MNEMGGSCSTLAERSGTYRVLVRKPEGKRPLGYHGVGWRIIRWIFRKWDAVH
jgi:hypothetical protein